MSIKESLEAFVAHVQSLREEDESGEDGYTKEFQMLKQQSNVYRVEGTFPTSEGEKDYNRRKNRYKDILPFDYTRVVLPSIPGLPGSDYVNANYIKGATGEQSYIAAQGPLPITVADFWRMVWDNKVKVLIMTANEYEGGKLKCACYWPKTKEERQYGDISLTLLDEKERGSKDFVVRQFLAKHEEEEARVITQLHYIAWPDHAVPLSLKPLIDMVALARDIQPDDQPPLLIHCSAGCGRTGTLCAIDIAWTLLKMGRITPEFSLFDIVHDMRKQRPSSVQALDQYILAHHAIAQLFSRHLELINQHFNLPDNHLSISTLDTNIRVNPAEESPYENVASLPAYLESTLDNSSSLIDDNNGTSRTDVIGKAIKETVKGLLNKPGIQLVPLVGQKTEPIRPLPSPRIRAKKADVENGYTHIQLKNPLPNVRKCRMERNSSSSSSRSSTSSLTQPDAHRELHREPIKSEPDYEVLSRFKSGEPANTSKTPALNVPSPSHDTTHATKADQLIITSQSNSLDSDSTCFVFSPLPCSQVQGFSCQTLPACQASSEREEAFNAESAMSRSMDSPMLRSTESPMVQSCDSLMMRSVDSPMAGLEPAMVRSSESPMVKSDYSMRSDISSSSDLKFKQSACSPRLSPSESLDNQPPQTDCADDGSKGKTGSSECVLFEDNLLYEQSSASVREKWPIHRGFSPPSNRAFQPGTLPLFPTSLHPESSHHTMGAPHHRSHNSPSWSARSPEVTSHSDAARKPQPLPKPKASPTSSNAAEASASSIPDSVSADMYTQPERKTFTALSPVSQTYSYSEPGAVTQCSHQHGMGGVGIEDGDYAELRNTARSAFSQAGPGSAFSPPGSGVGLQPALPPRSTSISHHEDVHRISTIGSESDEEAPQLPPKTSAAYMQPGDEYDEYDDYEEDDSITSQMSRSLDTLSDTVTTGVLTFGRKIKQKVQQTFGKTPGSPPEGLMLASPPGSDTQGQGQDSDAPKSMSIFYKGMDISFPNRVPRPQGPRLPSVVNSPNDNSGVPLPRH